MYNSLNLTRSNRRSTVESTLNGVNIRDDSKPWLIQNLDPFHDRQFHMGAPPTQSQLDSVVQVQRFRRSLTMANGTSELSIYVPPVPYGCTVRGL